MCRVARVCLGCLNETRASAERTSSQLPLVDHNEAFSGSCPCSFGRRHAAPGSVNQLKASATSQPSIVQLIGPPAQLLYF